jgi:hypothetical protein
MNVKKALTVTVLIVTICVGIILALKTDQPDKSKQLTKRKVLEITFKAYAPFSQADVTLLGYGGKLSYVGKQTHTENPSEVSLSMSIDEESFSNFVNLLDENGFWEMEKEYVDYNLLDGVTYILTVKYLPAEVNPELADQEIKEVKCYEHESCIEFFNSLESEIENIIGQELIMVGI